MADKERGLGTILLLEDSARHLATVSDGDARKCLNALGCCSHHSPDANAWSTWPSDDRESIQRKRSSMTQTGMRTTARSARSSRTCVDPAQMRALLARKILHARRIVLLRAAYHLRQRDVGMAD
jgi:putative ATPase